MPLYVYRPTIVKYIVISSLIGLALGLLIYYALSTLTPLYAIWDVLIAIGVTVFAGLIGGLLGLIEGDMKGRRAKNDDVPSY